MLERIAIWAFGALVAWCSFAASEATASSERSSDRPGPAKRSAVRYSAPLILPTNYVGDRSKEFDPERARPTALAAADFDEDGTVDLVVGYVDRNRGLVTFRRGNVKAVYPHVRMAGSLMPFGLDVRVDDVPTAPDFLLAGDYDADGHQDLFVAARGARRFTILAGDGGGGFSLKHTIKTPGGITAVTSGEIHRRDGLADLAVATEARDSREVLIFQDPRGAAHAAPRRVVMRETATAVMMGRFDGDVFYDLAVTTEFGHFSVSGCDHLAARFGSTGSCDELIARPADDRAWDRLAWLHDTEWSAQRSLRLNRDGIADLVVLPRHGGGPAIVSSVSAAIITVNTKLDNSTAADELCSLREAILNANGDTDVTAGDCVAGAGMDTIEFNIQDPVPRIRLTGLLPAITDSLTIDGFTQPGSSSSMKKITLSSTSYADYAIAVSGSASNGTVLRGITIFHMDTAILVENASNVTIEGCNIGTNGTGDQDFGINGSGIALSNSHDSLIGGPVPAARNIIASSNDSGVLIRDGSSGNAVEGNYIGTDASGLQNFGNYPAGVTIVQSNANTVGGTAFGAGNLISANLYGVEIWGAPPPHVASGNTVQGNIIGLDSTGSGELGNESHGVAIFDAATTLVGGPGTGARNVISSNLLGDGVHIEERFIDPAETTGNAVQGNYIGTDVTGTLARGNGEGVFLYNVPSNLVGGRFPGEGNLLSGNIDGVLVLGFGSAVQNRIEGNLIGTGAGGVGFLPNDSNGVVIQDGSQNSVGGAAPGASNIIAGNGKHGIVLLDFYTSIPTGGNGFLGNLIFANGDIAIDLGFDGPTPNDPGDLDTGANDLQNYPEPASAEVGLSSVSTTGSIDTVGAIRVEFFSGSACGMAERYLGFTDAIGGQTFASPLPVRLTPGEIVHATATNASGSSSELTCLTTMPCGLQTVGPTLVAPNRDRLEWGATLDVRYARGPLSGLSGYATDDLGLLASAGELDISSDTPAPGLGMYYLVREQACGSWQTTLTPPGEPARDVNLETPACGDGILDVGESCDDGNQANGDGCTSDCNVEPSAP
ncbi:MAG: hypothetical protein GY716_23360 [bacterium]|nr:hypothetical protein [bacterium]